MSTYIKGLLMTRDAIRVTVAFVSASSHLQFVEGAPCAVFVFGICMNVKCMHERRKEFANLTSD